MLKTCEGNRNDFLKSAVLDSLGLAYRDHGDLNKAKDFFQQAYDMIMACEGHDNSKVMYKRNLDEIEKMLGENQ